MHHLLKLVSLLAVAVVSTATSAQTTANGPYYATPSWDMTLPAATRFVILSNFNNEAVLDRETGLVWQRSPQSLSGGGQQNSFNDAVRVCSGANTGGRYGWRVPRFDELRTIFDPASTTAPTLFAGFPQVNFPTSFMSIWTSTPVSGSSGSHYVAGFGSSFGVSSYWIGLPDNGPGTPTSALCVRGPGGG